MKKIILIGISILILCACIFIQAKTCGDSKTEIKALRNIIEIQRMQIISLQDEKSN
jgi:hypothetical protein